MPCAKKIGIIFLTITLLWPKRGGEVIPKKLKRDIQGKHEINMTPAINTLKKAKFNYKIHSYIHDPSKKSYGSEAAEKMGVPEEKVFKTLVVSLDNKALAVAMVPVSKKLSMKRIAKAAGAKINKRTVRSRKLLVNNFMLGNPLYTRSCVLCMVLFTHHFTY